MIIKSNSKLGKFIKNNFFSLIILAFTAIFYGIYNDDPYGIFGIYFVSFGI